MVFAFILSIVATLAAIGFSNSKHSPTVYSFNVVNVFPHDENAFCQGLDFDGKTLFESTGKYGQSSVRRVNLETGKVEKEMQLDRRLFGEGLTLVNDKVFQLTWQRGLGYVYDAKTLEPLSTFKYDERLVERVRAAVTARAEARVTARFEASFADDHE